MKHQKHLLIFKLQDIETLKSHHPSMADQMPLQISSGRTHNICLFQSNNFTALVFHLLFLFNQRKRRWPKSLKSVKSGKNIEAEREETIVFNQIQDMKCLQFQIIQLRTGPQLSIPHAACQKLSYGPTELNNVHKNKVDASQPKNKIDTSQLHGSKQRT